MNAREVNAVLTKAALFDPRMKRTDEREQAAMAIAWAEALDDVTLEQALNAVTKHYRAESRPIMPADILELAGVQDEAPSPYRDITDDVLADQRARALAAAGVSEAEYAEHEHDPAWVRAKFAGLELER